MKSFCVVSESCVNSLLLDLPSITWNHITLLQCNTPNSNHMPPVAGFARDVSLWKFMGVMFWEVGKGACLVCHRLNFAWRGQQWSWSGFFWNGWSDDSVDLCVNCVCSWFRSLRDQSDGRAFGRRMSQHWAVSKSSQNEHFWIGITPAAHNNSTFCLLYTSVNVL